jgi:hypothetical protein
VDVLVAARARFLQVKGRELTGEELQVVAGAIKKARIVGNRVFPGPGESVLRFQ